MKRTGLALILLALMGCSTAPLADFLDFVAPGRIPPGSGQPSGGVCQPQGGTPGAPGAPITNVIPPPFPGPVGVTPLPGSGGNVIPPPLPPAGNVIPPPVSPGGNVIPPPVSPGGNVIPPPAPPGGGSLPLPFPTGPQV